MSIPESNRRLARAVPLIVLLLASLLAGVSCRKDSSSASATPSQAISQVEADTLMKFYAKDRAETDEWLKSKPTSYLATILRRDFNERTSVTVGSAAGNDVRVEDPGIRPHHLRVTVVGDSFRVETIDRGATFQVKDSTMTRATLPRSRASGLEAGAFESGFALSPAAGGCPTAAGRRAITPPPAQARTRSTAIAVLSLDTSMAFRTPPVRAAALAGITPAAAGPAA